MIKRLPSSQYYQQIGYKQRPEITCSVSSGTLNINPIKQSINQAAIYFIFERTKISLNRRVKPKFHGSSFLLV